MRPWGTLASLCEVVNVSAATRERFLTPTIGGGWTVAAPPSPSWEPRSLGYVCPSYGMERETPATHEIPMDQQVACKVTPFRLLITFGRG